MRPEDAEKLGVTDKQTVQVKIKTPGRTTTFGDVVARVNANFMPYMHMDTDEANACGAAGNVEGEIIV
jgi:putative phosphotransacetylase